MFGVSSTLYLFLKVSGILTIKVKINFLGCFKNFYHASCKESGFFINRASKDPTNIKFTRKIIGILIEFQHKLEISFK